MSTPILSTFLTKAKDFVKAQNEVSKDISDREKKPSIKLKLAADQAFEELQTVLTALEGTSPADIDCYPSSNI